MRPFAPVLLLAALSPACSILTSSSSAIPCEGNWGDFPPAQCGVLAARAVGVSPGGAILVMGPRGAGYTSQVSVVRTAGDFTLIALHYSSEAPFDTAATVTLGAFASADAVTPDAQPQTTAQVHLRFTRIGSRADTTYAGDIIFQ